MQTYTHIHKHTDINTTHIHKQTIYTHSLVYTDYKEIDKYFRRMMIMWYINTGL